MKFMTNCLLKIIGQNSILRKMSDVLATRLSNWSDKERPRGVFLLGGPTGVGKTETSCSTSTDTLWETKQSHSHQFATSYNPQEVKKRASFGNF